MPIWGQERQRGLTGGSDRGPSDRLCRVWVPRFREWWVAPDRPSRLTGTYQSCLEGSHLGLPGPEDLFATAELAIDRPSRLAGTFQPCLEGGHLGMQGTEDLFATTETAMVHKGMKNARRGIQ